MLNHTKHHCWFFSFFPSPICIKKLFASNLPACPHQAENCQLDHLRTGWTSQLQNFAAMQSVALQTEGIPSMHMGCFVPQPMHNPSLVQVILWWPNYCPPWFLLDCFQDQQIGHVQKNFPVKKKKKKRKGKKSHITYFVNFKDPKIIIWPN